MQRFIACVVPVFVLLLCVLSLPARAQNPMPPANTPQVKLPLRAQVDEVEKQAAALAKTIRTSKPSPELDKQRDELKALVAKSFGLWQNLQTQEIEQLRGQLAIVEQAMQNRAQQRDKILERRLQDLLSEDVLAWPAATPTDDRPAGARGGAEIAGGSNQGGAGGQSSEPVPLLDSPVVALKPLAERGQGDPRTIRADGRSEVVSAKIQQALEREVEVNFTETPLTDAIEYLSQQSKLTILIDQSVDATGTPSDTPISMPPLRKLRLSSILRLMLRPLNLTTVIDNDVLKVTTVEDAQSHLVLKVYQLGDLLDPSQKLGSLEWLGTAIRISTSSMWADTDGVGGSLVVQFNTQSLVISQTTQVHEEIENLLLALRTPRDPKVRVLRVDGERMADINAIEVALAKQVPISFQETPLSDVIAYCAEKAAIQILLDFSVEVSGTPSDSPVTIPLVNGTLKSALNLVLKPLNLTTIQRDGLLIVTTVEEAENHMGTRVYELEDLLDPANRANSLGGLMQTIRMTLGIWADTDGYGGSMSLAPTNARLVVRQTDATHEAITHLLDALRTKAP